MKQTINNLAISDTSEEIEFTVTAIKRAVQCSYTFFKSFLRIFRKKSEMIDNNNRTK